MNNNLNIYFRREGEGEREGANERKGTAFLLNMKNLKINYIEKDQLP